MYFLYLFDCSLILNGIYFFQFYSKQKQESVERSLHTIHEIAIDKSGSLCVNNEFLSLDISLNAERYEGSRQKAELAADIIQEVGINKHSGKYYLAHFI